MYWENDRAVVYYERTHACKMAFQARSTRIRDDGHAVLPCNVNNLHDILSRVRIDHDAMRKPYPKTVQTSANQAVTVR